jgi:hypothetical protein
LEVKPAFFFPALYSFPIKNLVPQFSKACEAAHIILTTGHGRDHSSSFIVSTGLTSLSVANP